ncbi:FCD domain-containing protein [Salipiger marinus]|uniref:FCD domain-containing protein n=1 Tax=Salipiger marinus TaxID=555512 RepID=UPI000B7EBCFF|nr:FCD domain-containing protein [Salipiger marinus]
MRAAARTGPRCCNTEAARIRVSGLGQQGPGLVGVMRRARGAAAACGDLVISLRHRVAQISERIADIVRQHRSIVAAVRARDIDQAVRAVQEHCDSARDDLLARM